MKNLRHILFACVIATATAAPSEKIVGFDSKFGDNNVVYVKVHTLSDDDLTNVRLQQSRINNIPFTKEAARDAPYKESIIENYSLKTPRIPLQSIKVSQEFQRYDFDPYLDWHGERRPTLPEYTTEEIKPVSPGLIELKGKSGGFDANRVDRESTSLKEGAINVEDNVVQDNQTRIARSDEDEDETTAAYAGEGSEEAAAEENPVRPASTRQDGRSTRGPKYISKLGYDKSTPAPGSVISNLVERNSYRTFRSRCRCEKISNCPKLQITVPRCPNEYFLCCF